MQTKDLLEHKRKHPVPNDNINATCITLHTERRSVVRGELTKRNLNVPHYSSPGAARWYERKSRADACLVNT